MAVAVAILGSVQVPVGSVPLETEGESRNKLNFCFFAQKYIVGPW